MKAKQIIEALHRHPDDVPPKSYLLATKPLIDDIKRKFVIDVVEDNIGDPREAVAAALVKLGVPRDRARMVGLEQGSSQACVNRNYLKGMGLTGKVLDDATDFVRFVYRLERNEDYLERLYDRYTSEK